MATCVLCAIMKNEQLHLDEWISHHLSLGIERIFLYEDVNSIPHDDIVAPYGDRVVMEKLSDPKFDFLYNNLKSKQEDVYNWFMINHCGEYDYVGFIDCDEFMFFAEGYDLERLISEHTDDKNGFVLYWKLFSANGNIEPQKSLIESCPVENSICYQRGEIPYKTFMSLRRPSVMVFIHNGREVLNTNGEIPDETKPDLSKAWLNHYFTKSWDEWCDRFISRGDLIVGNRKIDEFFKNNEDMRPRRDELMERFEMRKAEYQKKKNGRL